MIEDLCSISTILRGEVAKSKHLGVYAALQGVKSPFYVLIDVPRFINIRTYGMIKTIIRVMYSAFISIVLISIVLAGWTTYSFIFQTSKSTEISKVIQDMYASQKSVLVDFIDLSKILIKDTSYKINNDNENISLEIEPLIEKEEDSQLDQLPIPEDNGDNPLGIVIQPSLSEVDENRLPEIIEEPFLDEQNEFSMNEMKMKP